MTTSLRFTSAHLEAFPEDGKLYEIIDGELYVSRQPHYFHQLVCSRLGFYLHAWSEVSKAGQVTLAPGIIFAEDDDVAPDVIWISNSRLAVALREDGKLHSAPELVVEVLSPGARQERRDREAKLTLYSRRGVDEYWIVDWRTRLVEVHRRHQARLEMAGTFYETDSLETPLLAGFSCSLSKIFEGIPS
ncbi:MAG: Uma2 family endonuclease [Acidobacteriota bacterium]